MRILRNAACLLLVAWPCLSATYYVDPAALAGLNDGSSWANAWTNFASISWKVFWDGSTKVGHGDTLLLSGGTVSQLYNAPLTIGTSDNVTSGYISIGCGVDSGHNGLVIINGAGTTNCIETGGVNGIYISGQVSGDKQRHILLQNAGSPDTGQYLLQGKGIQGSCTYAVAEYLTVSNCWNGIEFKSSTNTTVRFCNLTNILGDAAINLGASAGAASDNVVNDCHIEVNYEADADGTGPDAIQFFNGVTVSNCVVVGQIGSVVGSQHQDGVQQLGSYARVCNNIFKNLANSACECSGLYSPDAAYCGGIEYFNNVVYLTDPALTNNWPRGFEWSSSFDNQVLGDFLVANNTFVDEFRWSAIKFFPRAAGFSLSNVFILNNVIFNSGATGEEPILIDAYTGAVTNHVVIDYNNLNAGTKGNSTIKVNGSVWIQPHDRTAAPTFMAYALLDPANNFRLSSADTSCRNLATNLASIFTYDIDSKRRSIWDIGAYASGVTLHSTTVHLGNLKGK